MALPAKERFSEKGIRKNVLMTDSGRYLQFTYNRKKLSILGPSKRNHLMCDPVKTRNKGTMVVMSQSIACDTDGNLYELVYQLNESDGEKSYIILGIESIPPK